jgi:hypothetical protein
MSTRLVPFSMVRHMLCRPTSAVWSDAVHPLTEKP